MTADGKAKYTGLHSLRHFYASWLINRKEDGGLGLPPKVVQERLGHALDHHDLWTSTDTCSRVATIVRNSKKRRPRFWHECDIDAT